MRPPHWDHYKNLAPTPPLSKPLTNSRLITVLPTPAGCFNQNPTIGKNSVGSVGLRYSLTTYGSGFKRASLELARHVYTGWSTAFGREKITASEKLAEAWPGENIQSAWKPVKRHTEPTIIAMNSIPSRNDIVTLLQSIGCIIHNVLLLVP
jgi:hypothetical protein